eukprot:1387701-Rhodomonas_salina.1
MIGNAFPVFKVVDRNMHGAVKQRCLSCGRAEESYLHFQSSCEENKQASMAAHNAIVPVLTDQLGERCQRVKVHLESSVWAHGPCLDPQLAAYQPDAIVEFEKDLQTYLVLVEFTRSFDKTPEVRKRKIAEKRQAYWGAMRHLQSQRPGCIVMQQTY